ncbi:MAG TPA: 50S ribosomal protein L25/general stress protein Ctc [Microbacteriaceae bacterium]|nr:50S ribosomal protein L25/general stress protein Ctc [Microbacteriaceae bacterium]
MSNDENNDEKIVARRRTEFGKGFARRLRVAGLIPAVIYGHKSQPQHIAVPAHQTSLLLRKANAVLRLEVDGVDQLALVKDVQRNPVKQTIEHLDLIVVRRGEKVRVEVPVHLDGETFPGTIPMIELQTLQLEVEATQIPEHVVVAVGGAEEGTQVFAGAIPLPAGAVLLDDPKELVVNVVVPRASAEDIAADEAAEAAAEGAPAAAAE